MQGETNPIVDNWLSVEQPVSSDDIHFVRTWSLLRYPLGPTTKVTIKKKSSFDNIHPNGDL